jgi:hypothetical protein
LFWMGQVDDDRHVIGGVLGQTGKGTAVYFKTSDVIHSHLLSVKRFIIYPVYGKPTPFILSSSCNMLIFTCARAGHSGSQVIHNSALFCPPQVNLIYRFAASIKYVWYHLPKWQINWVMHKRTHKLSFEIRYW